jgi:hypothetical protein
MKNKDAAQDKKMVKKEIASYAKKDKKSDMKMINKAIKGKK